MFTTCYTAEMDSAPKNHMETTLEVLFLKNAYCILSMAIYLFWDSAISCFEICRLLYIALYKGDLIFLDWKHAAEKVHCAMYCMYY